MSVTNSLTCRILFSLLMIGFLSGCDAATKADAAKQKSNDTTEQVQEEAKSDTKKTETETTQESAGSGSKEAAETKTADKETDAKAVDAKTAVSPLNVEVAGGAVKFVAPGTWKSAKPKSSMIEFEITVPKTQGEAEDAKNGRLTIMRAGGDVDANINRWYGQYTQPDGSETKDNSTVTDMTAADCDIKLVDIKGTLQDRAMGGGPFSGGKTVERENYRMLAAIIQTGEFGQYFVKLYGPEKTITANEKAFKDMIKSLQVKLKDGESL